jgi:hypothetical protein
MIEIDSVAGEGWVTIRCRGALSNDDFAALARTIGELNPDRALLVFFDWLDIEQWSPSPPDANLVAPWRRAARRIMRVAIVHGRRFDRQAACLGAALREEGVAVRSWRPDQAVAATAWLSAAVAERS